MHETQHTTKTISTRNDVTTRQDATPPAQQDGTPATPPDGLPIHSLRAGGVAALVQAATFVFGFVIYGTVIASADYGSPGVDPATHVAFLADNQLVLHVWYAVIYLVFGAALVVLAPAVYDRLQTRAPVLARSATVFGLIWATLMFAVGMSAIVGGDMAVALRGSDPAQAASLWTTVNLLVEGMGGGIELVGGLWMLLVGVAGLRAGVFPTWLNRVAVVAGTAGVASTALVATDVVTGIFGLGSIVWFTWLGVHMVAVSPRATAAPQLTRGPDACRPSGGARVRTIPRR